MLSGGTAVAQSRGFRDVLADAGTCPSAEVINSIGSHHGEKVAADLRVAE